MYFTHPNKYVETAGEKKMGKQYELKKEKRWVVIAFSIGAAVGSLYGAFILGLWAVLWKGQLQALQ